MSKQLKQRRVFPLTSRLIFLSNLRRLVLEAELLEFFAEHGKGNWGHVSAKLRERNNRNLVNRGQIVSEFEASNGIRFRITTTRDSKFTEFQRVNN